MKETTQYTKTYWIQNTTAKVHKHNRCGVRRGKYGTRYRSSATTEPLAELVAQDFTLCRICKPQ